MLPILLFLLLFHPYSTISILPPNFHSNLTLIADASLNKSIITLTNPTNPNSIGRALHSFPIRFLHPKTRESISFSTKFTFSIIPSPSFGSGFTFLLTSNLEFLGPGNGFLGFLGLKDNCTSTTIGVEFDTDFNADLRDLDDNHVALDICSIFSSVSASVINSNLDLKKGEKMNCWVEYKSSESLLTVYLSYFPSYRPVRPVLVAYVNLLKLVREFMYVGFSASNGPGTALHLIENWSFHSTFDLDSPSPSSSLTPLMDYNGDDEFLNFKEENPPKNKQKNKRILGPVLGSISALILLILCTTIMYLHYNPNFLLHFHNFSNPRETQQIQEDEMQIEQELGRIPNRISMHEIKTATSGFNRRNILGRGSSSTVYEGKLPSGSKIAVKKFTQIGHFRGNFASELGATIASCNHRNLVPLKGWCRHKEELILVYEYMPNGNLHDALHLINRIPLNWGVRYKILKGVATGLEFLHNRCNRKILHRDVKACNVLLDEGFNARLGDLGFAHLSSHGRDPVPTQVVGTPGYMAPEYVLTGVATEKADVYSFGVLVLETATGRLPVENLVSVVDWVWEKRSRRRLVDAADPRLGLGFDERDMVRVLSVGLACCLLDSNRRPSMKRVLRILEGNAELPSLPNIKPGFGIPVLVGSGNSSLGSNSSYHSCN